jgi:hypothetical protein
MILLRAGRIARSTGGSWALLDHANSSGGWNRRDFVGAAALAALALGLPSAAVVLSGLDDADAPSPDQRALLGKVADLVIPATDTPGAAAAGVGDFVLLALAHGLLDTRAPLSRQTVTPDMATHLRTDGSLRYAQWLEVTLNRTAGGNWLGKPATLQQASLAAIDAAAFAAGADGHPWRKLKALILTGYYTSEIGGSVELQYAPVPGRFDPAVPVTPDSRAYSNEWTGVDFG